MVLMKYLLPALAAVSLSAADDCKGKQTIQSSGDAAKLTCTKVDGDVEVTKDIADTLNLDKVEEITGSLSIIGAENVTSITAPKLKTIGDTFKLSGLTKLQDLSFDGLEEVGSIEFEALAVLQHLNFAKGVSKASEVKITNTHLNSLSGINLETVKNMVITNNPLLKEVDVQKITNVTGFASFSANHKDLKISFPHLEAAQNISIRNVSSVSLPSLEKTEGLLGLYSNYIEEFIAGNLTHTGDLVFTANSNLQNISLPQLKDVKGTFQIANNTKLSSLDGVPKLETIDGALDFTGNFTKVEVPKLKEVVGDFNLQSSGQVDCESYKTNSDDNVRGTFTCKSKVDDPQTKDGSKTSDSSPSESTDAGAALSPPASMSMLALIFGAFQLAI